ncbi:flavin reductase family protein [Nocardia arizonensis]|uniref:flavin reductase family protein n=1 Tax=Nocardia arizonensis TaxID=1141647 RepID=UPI0006CFF53C|nr:flavin reductase family protein [Nocardia arizonensis]
MYEGNADTSANTSAIFDALVARADYPVFVVTVRKGPDRAGCLVGFTTQVSIDPPRFLVCISKANHTYRLAENAHHLAVHLLDRDQLSLATLFGAETGDEIDKFAHCDWHPGPANLPILDAAAGWFCGRVLTRHDLGDHVGFVLAPEAGSAPGSEVDAMRYDRVADLEPGHEA